MVWKRGKAGFFTYFGACNPYPKECVWNNLLRKFLSHK